MKKFLFLTLISGAIITTNAQAQTGNGPSTSPQQAKETAPTPTLQETKEKISPLMVEKTGLTQAQADKVVEILFEMRQAAGALGNLNETDRSTKLAELKATKEKKLNELLTPEQISAVKAFYADMGKNAEQKRGN